MRVVGYVRVSTDRQVDAGAGLDVQRRAVRAWCRAEGHRLVELVADAGVSGTLADRPALAEALILLREGKAQGLVVHRLDRLARDLVVQEQLLAEVWRMGATVSSTAAGEDAYLSDDPGDPSRRLIRQVLGVIQATGCLSPESSQPQAGFAAPFPATSQPTSLLRTVTSGAAFRSPSSVSGRNERPDGTRGMRMERSSRVCCGP